VDRYGEDEALDVLRRLAVAHGMAEVCATVGVHHPRDLTGRVDCLEAIATEDPRGRLVDLSEIVARIPGEPRPRARDLSMSERIEKNMAGVNREIMDAALPFFENDAPLLEFARDVATRDRGIGATLAGQIAARKGLREGKRVRIRLRGFAGDGLAFGCVSGMRIELDGYANDSVCNIMSGGKVIVRQPRVVRTEFPERNSVVGNAACYGASGGALYVDGRAGERFSILNKGATTVCTGAGSYACEYKTGGRDVFLGTVGPNFGSGMTGGDAFVYDPAEAVSCHLSPDVKFESATDAQMAELRALLVDYAEETGSALASRIIADWANESRHFRHAVSARIGAVKDAVRPPEPIAVPLAKRQVVA